MLDKTDSHDTSSPFHEGEIAVQEKLGVRHIEHWARQFVRDHMPLQHREFFTSMPFLVVAARDKGGRPWATVLAGDGGFVASPDERTLAVGARPAKGDALEDALSAGADMGILGIELATRRRNRVNGRIVDAGADGLVFRVDQSFGNCPQYIRERQWRRIAGHEAGEIRRGTRLNKAQQAAIAGSDTFFIASGFRGEGDNPAFGLDASHRGGEPGFVEVLDAGRIRFPDYAGNNHFNTIGNLIADPRSGYLFIDFSTGSLLQITGRATITWDPAVSERTSDARRLVTVEIEDIVEQRAALPLRWQADGQFVRSLRLVEKNRESADVISFVFEARDGDPLPGFEAGQHLPIELSLPGGDEKIRRTYSLSGAPGAGRYRISVKREAGGLASGFMHEQLETGSIVEARLPAGEFVLHEADAPAVLISAGVGITPMLSMLHALAAGGDKRQVLFVHGTPDGHRHAFADETRSLAAKRPGITLHTAYSRPGTGDRLGRDYHSAGRVDAALVGGLVPPL